MKLRKLSADEAARLCACLALTRAQRSHLLDCAAVEDDSAVPLQVLWHLYVRLGLRKGEGMGVRWADIDWANATLTIRSNTRMSAKRRCAAPPRRRAVAARSRCRPMCSRCSKC